MAQYSGSILLHYTWQSSHALTSPLTGSFFSSLTTSLTTGIPVTSIRKRNLCNHPCWHGSRLNFVDGARCI